MTQLRVVLVAANGLLVAAVVTWLLAGVVPKVRARWPAVSWLVVIAALLEVASWVTLNWVVPLVLEVFGDVVTSSPQAMLLVPAVVSLVNDLLQVSAVVLLALALLRAARSPQVS
jgi:hypothetical protein